MDFRRRISILKTETPSRNAVHHGFSNGFTHLAASVAWVSQKVRQSPSPSHHHFYGLDCNYLQINCLWLGWLGLPHYPKIERLKASFSQLKLHELAILSSGWIEALRTPPNPNIKICPTVWTFNKTEMEICGFPYWEVFKIPRSLIGLPESTNIFTQTY